MCGDIIFRIKFVSQYSNVHGWITHLQPNFHTIEQSEIKIIQSIFSFYIIAKNIISKLSMFINPYMNLTAMFINPYMYLTAIYIFTVICRWKEEVRFVPLYNNLSQFLCRVFFLFLSILIVSLTVPNRKQYIILNVN